MNGGRNWQIGLARGVAALLIALAATACASSPLAGKPTVGPTAPSTAAAPVELRVLASQSRLRSGEAVELIAEGQVDGEWREMKALWHVQPEGYGILEVPPQQREGLSRTFFTARAVGQVTVIAEPVDGPGFKGTTVLSILPAATPAATTRSATAVSARATPSTVTAVRGTPFPQPSTTPIRTPPAHFTATPKPTPRVVDSPALREAIVRLDALDRQVLGESEYFIMAFRAYGDKKASQEQMCAALGPVPARLEAATAALKAFVPPPDLASVHAEYVAVAEGMRRGLGGLEEFCRTSDQAHLKTYVDATADAFVRSVFAKQELDAICAAIGLPPPRSTRVPAARTGP